MNDFRNRLMALYLLAFVPIGTVLKWCGRDLTWWDVFSPWWSVVLPFLVFNGIAAMVQEKSDELAEDDEE